MPDFKIFVRNWLNPATGKTQETYVVGWDEEVIESSFFGLVKETKTVRRYASERKFHLSGSFLNTLQFQTKELAQAYIDRYINTGSDPLKVIEMEVPRS